jgi:saccharopepsin
MDQRTPTHEGIDAFEDYQTATGAALDYDTGMLRITPDQYDALVDLDIVIGGKSFTLTPNAQLYAIFMARKTNSTNSYQLASCLELGYWRLR